MLGVDPPTASDVAPNSSDLSSLAFALFEEESQLVSLYNLRTWLLEVDNNGFALSRLPCLEYNGAATLHDLWEIAKSPTDALEGWYGELQTKPFEIDGDVVKGFTAEELVPLRVAMSVLRTKRVLPQ
jgi:hypothetical protein